MPFASSDDVRQQHSEQLKLMAERQMNIRPLCSALILGVMLAVAGPPIQSMGQSTDPGVSASKRVSQNTNRKSTAIGGTVADSIRILAADGFVPRRLPQRRGRRPIEKV